MLNGNITVKRKKSREVRKRVYDVIADKIISEVLFITHKVCALQPVIFAVTLFQNTYSGRQNKTDS